MAVAREGAKELKGRLRMDVEGRARARIRTGTAPTMRRQPRSARVGLTLTAHLIWCAGAASSCQLDDHS